MHRGRGLLMLGVLFAGLPILAHAQVSVSEIMYDAPGSDDTQEWVEIFNEGATVDLSKWKVNDGSNHVLNAPPKNGGQGTITLESGAYAVLADDATAFLAGHPGFSGTVIDTTLDLGNTSDTVSLIDDSGTVADSVSYTKEAGAAGDGNTLRRAGAGVVPAAPTPGAANASAPLPPASEPDAGGDAQPGGHAPSTPDLAPVSSASAPPEQQLFADAGPDRTVMVGADALFEARVRGKKGEAVTPGRYLWTFGDGSVAEGKSVMHHFMHPGRYVVVLDVAQGFEDATDRLVVTAVPPAVSVSTKGDAIVLTNAAAIDLDLSFWHLRSGGRVYQLPKHTFLLAGEAVAFPSEVTHLAAATDTALIYPNGVLAMRLGDVPPAAMKEAAADTPAPVAAAAYRAVRSVAARIAPVAADKPAEEDAAGSSPPAPSQLAAAGVASPGVSLWFWAAFGLSALAAIGFFASRRARQGEWTIIDDTPEDL